MAATKTEAQPKPKRQRTPKTEATETTSRTTRVKDRKPKPGDSDYKKVNRRKAKKRGSQNTGLLDDITNPRRQPRSRSFNDTNSGLRTQEPWRIAPVENLAHYALLQLQKHWSAEELIGTAHAYVSVLFRPVGYYPAGNQQRITQAGDLKFIEDKLFFMNSTVAKQVRVVVAGVIVQMTAKDDTVADLEFPCLKQDWFVEAQAEALASLAKTDTSTEESEEVKESALAAA